MYSPVAVFLGKNREGPCNEDLFNATFLASEVLKTKSAKRTKKKNDSYFMIPLKSILSLLNGSNIVKCT